MEIDVKLINEMIIIYNSLGQKLKTTTIKPSPKNNTGIDATILAGGIYYLGIDNITRTKSINFIKIR